MSVKITTHHDYIILDACVVMNLYASGQMEDILSAISETVTVAIYVVEIEALSIYKKSKSDVLNGKEPVQLHALFEKGLLIAVDLESEAEKAFFLSLSAQRLDDGEAITMAIAKHRNWAVATDDRRAIRIFNSQYSQIQIISTPELIKHWQESKKPESNVLYQTIVSIEEKANYLVGKNHTLYKWWQKCKV